MAGKFGKQSFGRIEGTDIYRYSISNGTISASILSYGARLQSLMIGDRQVVIGFDDIHSYMIDSKHFGGVIGRLCNRTRGGLLQIRNQTYQLENNSNGHHLHGGSSCFDARIWDLVALDDSSITLALHCPNGEANYPGSLRVEVTYSLQENAMVFSYAVSSDMATKVNITNHSYFNLNGEGDVLGHMMLVNSDEIAVRDKDFIFTSLREPYKESSPHLLSNARKSACFLLQEEAACTVESNGLRMKVSTSLPALLFFCADSSDVQANAAPKKYSRRYGFCPETLFLPNEVPILEMGQSLQEWTRYEFSYVGEQYEKNNDY